MEKWFVHNDWCAAKRLLMHDDNVEKFSKLVRTYHIHARDRDDWTLLHWACGLGRVRSAGWMLESGANKEARSIGGQTSLHLAAANGRASCVALLLCNGAHADPVDNCGWTPLSRAVDEGHQQAGRLLLDAGANVELARNKIAIPPWMDAIIRKRATACNRAAVAAFASLRPRLGRDMARLIATLVCTTRGAKEWAIIKRDPRPSRCIVS